MQALPKAFQQFIISIPLDHIVPQVAAIREKDKGITFRQIAASIREIGLIEPLVVFPRSAKEYLLLDGHNPDITAHDQTAARRGYSGIGTESR